ncbi:glycosyltransferase [Solitalea koreensis]|uniref:Glycosyltransferase, GT2 family n=1 Tax=Solitalea koreensis TaxID=543615 RepID=A0A521CIP2_9SPHI|nr:glycosyltransferase [Solitalea koreensis]SMO58611.1 Glycosyltransferase, GT2 family [Solitalea koreensis]
MQKKKNKLVKFNERLCLIIASKYYLQRENGKGEFYILKPRFWKYTVARILLEIISIIKLDKNTLQQYNECFKQTYFPLQIPQRPKSYLKARLKEALLTLLGLRYFCNNEYFKSINGNLSTLLFPIENNPKVSIIIPVYNQLDFTINSLASIKEHFSKKFPIEIIVVDDCSTDDTQRIISKIDGIKYIHNDQNIGFLNSCNKAVSQSSGEYICFLNNDTLILPNWLESLVDTIEFGDEIGAVGSQLLYPYGLLQEAGGLIFEDGSGCNYGRGLHPEIPKYNYTRQTDYCSGCSLLISTKDFNALGGFDTRYSPAYYEDTDLCFSVTYKLNKKVIYQPASKLIHFEGVSSGKTISPGNVKAYQEINRVKFIQKWESELLQKHQKNKALDDSARKYIEKPVLLVMDHALPAFDKESGANRMFQLLKIFIDKGYYVIYFPADGNKIEPYYSLLHNLNIEVIYKHFGRKEFHESLSATLPYVNLIWACRPEINRDYSYIKQSFPSIKWIYDTIDLHYLRFEREYELSRSMNKKLLQKVIDYKQMEIELATSADVTVTITDKEKEILQANGVSSLQTVPNIHVPHTESLNIGFDGRKDLLFIGGYYHKPNVDAALWLSNEIMPVIWQQTPEMKLFLVGSHPPKEVRALANERIIVTGYVPDVTPYFNSARVFVAPLRYGAGMKGKIGQSLEYALPIVTTDIGAEGMHLKDNWEILLAHTAEEFAAKTLELYNNKDLWLKLRKNAKKAIEDKSPESIKASLHWLTTLHT